jgi:CDGSH-type Zn-finger protein
MDKHPHLKTLHSLFLSENQPFCDGSHQRTEMMPLEFIATETTTVYFCGCKQSVNAPLCDGTHATL